MMEAKILRVNGKIETVDMTGMFVTMDKSMFNKIKAKTKKAGRGELLEIKYTKVETKSNIKQLVKKYNDLHNEGGEGYIPELSYFKKMDAYEESTKTNEYTVK